MAHEIKVTISGLSDHDAENLFRIVQYALESHGEYWRATNAEVTIRYPDDNRIYPV